jgi:hypothetical protein
MQNKITISKICNVKFYSEIRKMYLSTFIFLNTTFIQYLYIVYNILYYCLCNGLQHTLAYIVTFKRLQYTHSWSADIVGPNEILTAVLYGYMFHHLRCRTTQNTLFMVAITFHPCHITIKYGLPRPP